MTFRRLVIALAIGIATGVLVLLYGRRRDEYEYPDEPEPPVFWWTYGTPVYDLYGNKTGTTITVGSTAP